MQIDNDKYKLNFKSKYITEKIENKNTKCARCRFKQKFIIKVWKKNNSMMQNHTLD